MFAEQMRAHVQDGGVLYRLNKAGTVAHIQAGWETRIVYCGLRGTGSPVLELPEGVRLCANCDRNHVRHFERDLEQARRDALAGAYRLRYVSPADGVDELYTDTVRTIQSAPTPGRVWAAYRLFYDEVAGPVSGMAS